MNEFAQSLRRQVDGAAEDREIDAGIIRLAEQSQKPEGRSIGAVSVDINQFAGGKVGDCLTECGAARGLRERRPAQIYRVERQCLGRPAGVTEGIEQGFRAIELIVAGLIDYQAVAERVDVHAGEWSKRGSFEVRGNAVAGSACRRYHRAGAEAEGGRHRDLVGPVATESDRQRKAVAGFVPAAVGNEERRSDRQVFKQQQRIGIVARKLNDDYVARIQRCAEFVAIGFGRGRIQRRGRFDRRGGDFQIPVAAHPGRGRQVVGRGDIHMGQFGDEIDKIPPAVVRRNIAAIQKNIGAVGQCHVPFDEFGGVAFRICRVENRGAEGDRPG